MNDDEFENKLRALTGRLHRPDPTPAWKADILVRARREADAMAPARTLPPRWLVATWAAAWAAILLMNFTGPQETASRTTHEAAAAKPMPGPDTSSHGDSWALLAFHQRMNLNLDFPQ